MQTYDPSLPSVMDEVRLRLDDTGKADDFVLHNEEIEALVAKYGEGEGSARLAESLALYWAKRADDMTDADTKTSYKRRSDAYRDMAADIRANPSGLPAIEVAVGDINKPDMSQMRTD